MQEDQKVKRDPRRVGVKEDLIKFRPSPNFKNMKKFLKNRSDYNDTACSSASSPSTSTEPVVQQKVESQVEVKPTVFQPPLPTYPPPDSPPDLNITIKKEREDELESQEDESQAEPSINFEEMMTIAKQQPPKEEEKKPKKPAMCKEFIRGECNRPVCRFSHELDLNQLHGVFTFCWNYQNARCTHPNCKFVHATIFEEAEFYRTGNLPGKARRHLNKPPPPPPPPEENKVVNMVPPNPMMNPMANIHAEPLISCVPTSSMEAKPDYLAKSPPLKHSSSSSETKVMEETKLQYKKEKVEELIQSKEQTEKELIALDKKCKKLASVLQTILKPASMANNQKIGVGNMMADKNNYGIVSNPNLQLFLNKLLSNNGDPSLPTDVARES